MVQHPVQTLAAVFFVTFAVPFVAAAQEPEPVTFTRDIAPILQRSCQSCHKPGGIAPMSLITWEQVRPWASMIRLKTSRREMPPWFVEKNIGIQEFKDDISLSDEEIRTISRWVEAGAPQGDPADLVSPRIEEDTAAWSIGTPDLVVSSPTLRVSSVEADFMTEVGPVPTNLGEDRYIQSIEVKEIAEPQTAGSGPGSTGLNHFLVHHATISIDETEAPTPDLGPAPEGGGRRLMMYQMGQNPTKYPDDVGTLLPAGSALSFWIHVHAVGESRPVRLDVALKLYPRGYVPKHVLSPFSASPRFQREELDLPAGEDDIRIDGYTPVTRPMKLVTFVPHLHANGTRMCIEAIYPDGRPEMINCSRWDHNWSRQYFYEDDAAPLLPAGTMVHLIAWFDNSESNPRNVEPRNWKGYGNRTIDDMAYLLSEAIYLTEEEFQAEIAAREGRPR